MNVYHLKTHGEDWALLSEASQAPLVITQTRDEAYSIAVRFLERNTGKLVVHGKGGEYLEERSFSWIPELAPRPMRIAAWSAAAPAN